MYKIVIINFGWIVILLKLCSTVTGQASELSTIFGSCRKSSPDFDSCIKNGFNELRPFFKTGQCKQFFIYYSRLITGLKIGWYGACYSRGL